MSMFTDDMMPHQHLVDYLKRSGISKKAQAKVLRLVWKTEKNGWNPPTILKRRLDELTS